MTSLVLGIDQGTTGTRARVVDPHGAVLGQAYRAHAQHHPAPGHVEHDVEEIWAATLAVIAEALAAAGVDRTAIAGIGLANQGETVVAWDAKTGRPLGRALVWQDTRTQAAADRLAADDVFARAVTAKTGLVVDPYFSATKMRWLWDHAPGAAELEARGDLRLGTVDAWLVAKLTEGEACVTDVSTAARTLLFDIRTCAYDDELVRRFGVPKGALARIVPSTGVLARARIPLLEGVPLLASVVDQPAALYGHGCLAPGQIKATYGTGCFVYMNTGSAPPVAAPRGLLATVAWQRRGDATPTYALDGGIFAAGSVVEWLRTSLGFAATAPELDQLAASAKEPAAGDAVVCVPALAGLGAPHFVRGARAAWLGMDLGTTRADLVRAALDGIACRVAEVVRAMEATTGMRAPALRVDGGLTGSATLMQLQADALGVPVEVLAESEATVMGVAALAAREAGLAAEAREASPAALPAKVLRVFTPRVDAEGRARRAARFSRAVELVTAFAAPAAGAPP
jgi:glycerol kinase